MAKTIIREIIITLLICLLILAVLGILLYNYSPNKKVIPEKVTYQASQEVKSEINTEVQDDSDRIIKTYEITSTDLDKFEKSKEYNPGKADPFAAVSETVEGDGQSDNSSSGDITGEDISGGTSQDNNGGGSLFEKGNSK